MTHANNYGADQSAHMRRLICAIIVRCPESKASLLALQPNSSYPATTLLFLVLLGRSPRKQLLDVVRWRPPMTVQVIGTFGLFRAE